VIIDKHRQSISILLSFRIQHFPLLLCIVSTTTVSVGANGRLPLQPCPILNYNNYTVHFQSYIVPVDHCLLPNIKHHHSQLTGLDIIPTLGLILES